jgi:THO complex subunit 2
MEISYQTMLPVESWNHITQLLFSRFYSYAIYDLTCPEETYLIEIGRVKREIDRLEILQKGGRDAIGMQASMASAVAAAGGTEQAIREATAFTKEHAIDLERLKSTEAMLRSDMQRQKTHYGHVMKRLEAEKSDFLVNLTAEIPDTSSVFFTTCIYPRSLLSPEDAIYCARFIMLLHKMESPGFSTLQLIDVIVSAVVGALYSITENEAGCFGIFLNEVWNVVTGWRYDQNLYENEVSGKVRPVAMTLHAVTLMIILPILTHHITFNIAWWYLEPCE